MLFFATSFVKFKLYLFYITCTAYKALMGSKNIKETMNTDLEKRLVELEIKYTHQEELLDQLNKIVAKQDHFIEKINKELNEIKLSSIQSQESVGNEKPPHY